MPVHASLPYLFLLGRPAVGKSTVAQIILRVLALPAENYFPIDQAHYLLCNPEVQSPNFYYTPGGTLVFRDRAAVMREALEWLAQAAQKRRTQAPNTLPLLFEFAHYDYAAAFNLFGNEVVQQCAIIEVAAPITVARERNLARPAMDRVPEEWLQMAFDADVLRLAELVAPEKFVRLQNEHKLSQRELERRVREALRRLGFAVN
jgi:dephospho-CoA kinase